jgi:F-type H+-transporting ATPase subunit epsilon
MPIRVEVVSQDRPVFEGDVDIVVAPGVDGELGILPHHAPLLTTLRPGVLRVRRGTAEETIAISGGVLEVRPDLVTVLADSAERAEEIDLSRAEEARQRAEETMRSGAPRNSEAYLAAEAALRRSNLRIQVARRRRSTGLHAVDYSGDDLTG